MRVFSDLMHHPGAEMFPARHRRRVYPRRGRGTVPRLRPGAPPRITKSAVRLAAAESSPCPHCGRTTKTVQGVCADCWGSKGGRQFWVRKHGPRPSTFGELFGVDPFHPLVLAAAAASIAVGVLLWTSG